MIQIQQAFLWWFPNSSCWSLSRTLPLLTLSKSTWTQGVILTSVSLAPPPPPQRILYPKVSGEGLGLAASRNSAAAAQWADHQDGRRDHLQRSERSDFSSHHKLDPFNMFQSAQACYSLDLVLRDFGPFVKTSSPSKNENLPWCKIIKHYPDDPENLPRSKSLLLECVLSLKGACLLGVSLLKCLFVKLNQPNKTNHRPWDMISLLYLLWVMGNSEGFCILTTSWKKARLWGQTNEQKCDVHPAWRCWWEQNIGFHLEEFIKDSMSRFAYE